MADLPKISIVIPSFNQARFLRQAVESVLDQRYPNLELFVVDGGSSDDSPSIIRSMDPHLTWWISEADRGQAAAINKGFARATGEVFGWLNSDDYYLEGALHEIADAHRRHPDAGLLFGNGLRVDERGVRISAFSKTPISVTRHTLAYGIDYLLQPATFFSRSAWQHVGGLREDLHWCLDWDLWIRIADTHPAQGVDALVAASREHSATKTATGSFARWTEIREVTEKHTGMQLTPGALAYFLHTLHDYLRSDPQAQQIMAGLQRITDRYWGAVSQACLRPLEGSEHFPHPSIPGKRDQLHNRKRIDTTSQRERLCELIASMEDDISEEGRDSLRELTGHLESLQRQLAEQEIALEDLDRRFRGVAATLESHAERLQTMERRLWVKAGKAMRLI